jgi:hypothetical protein
MPGSQSNAAPTPLTKRLEAYGCTDVIPLDAKLSLPRQLEYLDLLPTRNNQTPTLAAVAEHQGTALLYLVDACRASNGTAASIAAVCRQLANRSDPAWLGVVQAGSLEIFPIGFHAELDARPVAVIEERNEMAPFFFQSLVHDTFEKNDQLRGTDYVYHKIFDLLMQTTNRFVPTEGKGKLDSLEVLSMAGRALFFRFLIDRRIVLENELHESDGICPAASDLKDVFSTPEKAARTSAWLDTTFNGDFLPLIDESIPAADRDGREAEYLRFYKRCEHLVGHKLFIHLQAILRGWSAVGGDFQPELDWGDLDFAHIPVGVLSQVYESFSHRADPRTARDTSVHYTPRTIASLMVDEAFAAVKNPAEAKVLDGSCGAGIFLVLAFRRLVRERWLHDNDERPKTSVIQEILYSKVRGFDTSESALRLAALALYITAIELNASPRPPKSLKFPRNLRGEVLHRFGGDTADEKKVAFPLGSLGPEVSPTFDNTFDIVIGNPPWTRLRDDKDEDDEDTTDKKARKSATDELNIEFTGIGRRVLTARGFTELAKSYKNPDKNPDMPFLWRAMEWANNGGVIALAMHPRLFMRAKGNGRKAWIAILRSIQVTGLLNGSDLRKTAVWEGMDAAFCLFFARNVLPKQGQQFEFASPVYEPEPNGRGRFRIDYETARHVSIARVEKQPWLLKTLSLGTWLDVEVMESLVNPSRKTLGQIWLEWDPQGNKTGEGFNRAPGSPQKFVDFLAKLPVIEPPSNGFQINYSVLRKYGDLYGTNAEGLSCANMPRREALFQQPLVIIARAPGENPQAPRAFISRKPIAFSKSYYGYSCEGHPDPETLASLIYLLAHSTLFRYFALMVSISQGVDYMLFTKQDFDALPFPDLEKLPADDKAEIRKLASRLEHDAVKPWQELDSFIFRLYGLDDNAVQVASDTLFSAAAYRKAGKKALERTTRDARADFVNNLRDTLEPYFDVCGQHVAVREPEFQPDTWREPWFFLSISREAETINLNDNLIRKAMEVANQRGCSRVIVHAPKKSGLLLGLLNERRWWTVSRARLCAQHIIRERLGACGLPEAP